VLSAALAAACSVTSADAAECGSALLLQVGDPAVFDEVNPSVPTIARFWEVGAGGSNRSDDGCRAGCTAVTGAPCAAGGDCLALTGVSWLNASCTAAGHLPARTAFLIEQTTADSGGRWAAINFDANAADANTDLDAKAAVVCGGCASIASPYVGGAGFPVVTDSMFSGGVLTATLSWSPPPAAAQALSNGLDLVTSYAVYYRGHTGPPPPSTGDPSGWTLVADLQPDGAANGGFSTDTGAEVETQVPGGVETVTFAIGLSFDGSGDPTTDPDTLSSSLISDQSDPVVASSVIFADGFESGDTSAWSSAAP
jgi:hypothetical protein